MVKKTLVERLPKEADTISVKPSVPIIIGKDGRFYQYGEDKKLYRLDTEST